LLKKRLDHRDSVSQRGLAQAFGVSQSTICKTIKYKTSIRYYHKKRAPKRTVQQKAVARAKCTKLTKLFRKKHVVIDDESYFGLSNFEIAGNAGFYSSDVEKTPKEIQLKRFAISPKGLSKNYFVLFCQVKSSTKMCA
jgi:hypothetical protein